MNITEKISYKFPAEEYGGIAFYMPDIIWEKVYAIYDVKNDTKNYHFFCNEEYETDSLILMYYNYGEQTEAKEIKALIAKIDKEVLGNLEDFNTAIEILERDPDVSVLEKILEQYDSIIEKNILQQDISKPRHSKKNGIGKI